jgi:hypothetical protein
MNLSQAGLVATIRQDIVSRQLSNTAAAKGNTFDPTSGAKKSNHETDKQSEDNATWVFEYRALLNSKLTTLITSLTTAYTTDMDASMGYQDAGWGGKNAMQGVTGVKSTANATIIDPGAARSTYAYLKTWMNAPATLPQGWGTGNWTGDSSNAVNSAADEGASGRMTLGTSNIAGTTTFMSGGDVNFLLDRLNVNIANTLQNNYLAAKSIYLTDDLISNPALAQVGNNFERTLYKFFARPENLDILRFGLFKDVYVVGTSSLPTGSQMQGSLSLNWEQNSGTVKIVQERYACFYHS